MGPHFARTAVRSLRRALSTGVSVATGSRKRDYVNFVAELKSRLSQRDAFEAAVGGDFELIGLLEREALIQFGLRRDSYLIDVGCGSGRLAVPLSTYMGPEGRYLGIDVVPDLLGYARNHVSRPDWRFEIAQGLTIPERSGRADMVSFYSVLTHLLHEHSYLYLQDAKRVLRPGGKIVFSFLEFRIPQHWRVFEHNLADAQANRSHLNQFISRDAIEAWAAHLELDVEAIVDATESRFPLPHPVVCGTRTVSGTCCLGQSLCVLAKR